MAKRYRRSYRSSSSSNWRSTETPPSVPVQSWVGRYEDAYRVTPVSEPDYSRYRYKSKLSEGWPWWKDPARSEMAAIQATLLTTDEIEDFLGSPVVENVLVVDGASFAAPAPVRPEFPPPPNDPTAVLNFQKPYLIPVPPPPERPIAKEADYGILGKPLGFINRTITRGQQRELDDEYRPKYQEWQANVERINQQNNHILEQHKTNVERRTTGSPEYQLFLEAKSYWEENSKQIDFSYAAAKNRWSAEQRRYDADAAQDARIVANLKADVREGHTDAIEAAAALALRNSIYQLDHPTVHYEAPSKILLVQYVLPDFERLQIVEPTKLKPLQGKRLTQQKERASCSLMVRACFDFACMLEESPVQALALNAEVTFIDPTTGHPRTEIVGSLFVRLDEMRKLNVTGVEPKAAFKALKGVSAGDFSRINPVPPIYAYNKADSRIVEGREIIGGLASETNLAAMHWEEFEHLIRQLFELEFAANGSEVKVTRASHDSGVDAIIYDPDPIRGGKIIIQAKRYVNTVDASAVRDLFGTVQSEGANKGILITTSSYGPESYEFVKNKPITLLNGENLLWLLKRHGHSFSIDLVAARKLLKEKGWL